MSSLQIDFSKIAAERLSSYDDRVMREHHEAMDCLDCEETVACGLGILKFIEDSEQYLREAAYDGYWEVPEDFENALERLYRWWLRPCDKVATWIKQHTKNSYSIDRSDEFNEACARVEYWLEQRDHLNASHRAQEQGAT